MEALYIKGTDVSPEINFNPTENIFLISGWSRPESPSKFYSPLKKWINEFGSQHLNNAVVHFKVAYFNTPSARTLREILDMLDKLYQNRVLVSVNWYYEDESSKEEFEYEFAQGLTIPIHFTQMD